MKLNDSLSMHELFKLFNLDNNNKITEDTLNNNFVLLLENNNQLKDEDIDILEKSYYRLKEYINSTYKKNIYNDPLSHTTSIVNNINNNDNSSNDYNSITDTNIISENIFTDSILKTNNLNIDNERNIIKKNIIHSDNVFNRSYQKSNLNNVTRDVIKKIVNIDSLFRNNNYNKTNDFIYELKNPIKNVISYKLSSIELPNIWYTFSDSLQNNEFTIIVYNYSTGNLDSSGNIIYENETSYNIKIPEGNYTKNEIITVINNIFSNSGLGLRYLKFDINDYTGKSIIRAKDITDTEYLSFPDLSIFPFNDISGNLYYSPNLKFKIYFDLQEDILLREQKNEIYEKYSGCIQTISCELLDIYNKNIRPIEYNCGYLLGFKESIYTVDSSNIKINIIKEYTPIEYKCFLETEGYFGDSIIKYIFLKVDDYKSNNYNSFICDNNINTNTDNILAKIPISSGSFSILFNNNSDFIFKERTFFGPVDLQKFRISLVDRFDRKLDIGSSNFSITLELSIIYN